VTTKRIIAIVGAGAVLDFDYSYKDAIVPSSSEITRLIKKIKVNGLNSEQSNVIEDVYTLANQKINATYLEQELRNNDNEINFEELYFLLESLLSNGVTYLNPNFSPRASVIRKIIPLLACYPSVEVKRGLMDIVRKITEIINGYNTHFKECNKAEEWYRDFWNCNSHYKWDVFTFNYDTTIEESMRQYEDGFVQMEKNEGFESFVPQKILRNVENLSTIQHLHGCIYYAESAPETRYSTHGNRDMFKYHSVDEAQYYLGLQQNSTSQDGESYLNSPILIGLRKLDKMTFLPNSVYYANLVNSLQRNSGLLIVGYSFGDMYVNQLLQKRKLMHGTNHRIVIIDCFPEYVDSKVQFYKYTMHHRPNMFSFLRPFVDFSFDDKFCLSGIVFTSHLDPIYSADHNCMFLVGGFKKAVELHGNLILDFLCGKKVD
jgi:hypothetical protein